MRYEKDKSLKAFKKTERQRERQMERDRQTDRQREREGGREREKEKGGRGKRIMSTIRKRISRF